jgi:hypothetical protein
MKHWEFYLGALAMFSGVSSLLRYRNRCDTIVGLTPKQFFWCGVVAILCGAVISIGALCE